MPLKPFFLPSAGTPEAKNSRDCFNKALPCFFPFFALPVSALPRKRHGPPCDGILPFPWPEPGQPPRVSNVPARTGRRERACCCLFQLPPAPCCDNLTRSNFATSRSKGQIPTLVPDGCLGTRLVARHGRPFVTRTRHGVRIPLSAGMTIGGQHVRPSFAVFLFRYGESVLRHQSACSAARQVNLWVRDAFLAVAVASRTPQGVTSRLFSASNSSSSSARARPTWIILCRCTTPCGGCNWHYPDRTQSPEGGHVDGSPNDAPRNKATDTTSRAYGHPAQC